MKGMRTGRGALLAGVLLLLGGCGYSLEGTRRPASLGDARSIAVPIFINASREPGLERTLTEAVRNRFLLDGRLRVVDTAEADLVLETLIREYKLEPIGFSGADQVRRYRIFIRTHVRLRNIQRGRSILDQEMESNSEFDITSAIGGTEAARGQTNITASNLFAEDLLSLVLEGF